MVKTYKELINEMHLYRAVNSVYNAAGGALAGSVFGSVAGAALETLGGIPGAAKVGRAGGALLGAGLSAKEGYLDAVKNQTDDEREYYEYISQNHRDDRSHLDDTYKKYENLVNHHNSLAFFKRDHIKLEPKLHESLNEEEEETKKKRKRKEERLKKQK